MSELLPISKTCTHCGQTFENNSMVCPNCGEPAHEESFSNEYERFRSLVVAFFCINLIVCLVFNFWPLVNANLTGLIIVDSFLFGCAVYYGYLLRDQILPLFSWKNFHGGKLVACISFAIVSASLVNYGVKWINRNVFESDLYYYSSFEELVFPKITMFVLIALMPAFSEELAYRGVIQTGLSKLMNSRQAVVLTALLFSIIHMSLISFFWLLPFALFLGWLRQREKTLWYGIVVHFFFNATTCWLELKSLGLI